MTYAHGLGAGVAPSLQLTGGTLGTQALSAGTPILFVLRGQGFTMGMQAVCTPLSGQAAAVTAPFVYVSDDGTYGQVQFNFACVSGDWNVTIHDPVTGTESNSQPLTTVAAASCQPGHDVFGTAVEPTTQIPAGNDQGFMEVPASSVVEGPVHLPDGIAYTVIRDPASQYPDGLSVVWDMVNGVRPCTHNQGLTATGISPVYGRGTFPVCDPGTGPWYVNTVVNGSTDPLVTGVVVPSSFTGPWNLISARALASLMLPGATSPSAVVSTTSPSGTYQPPTPGGTALTPVTAGVQPQVQTVPQVVQDVVAQTVTDPLVVNASSPADAAQQAAHVATQIATSGPNLSPADITAAIQAAIQAAFAAAGGVGNAPVSAPSPGVSPTTLMLVGGGLLAVAMLSGRSR